MLEIRNQEVCIPGLRCVAANSVYHFGELPSAGQYHVEVCMIKQQERGTWTGSFLDGDC